MAHSYSSCLVHYIFSTKNRRNSITAQLEERLWPYLGGIARENHMKALAIGGVANHIHMLLSLPSTITLAKAIQLIKGGSSKWIHDSFPLQSDFEWQEGYGAFSISISAIPDTVAYIKSQKEHHRTMSFEEEYIAILKKHGIDYDERYVWG